MLSQISKTEHTLQIAGPRRQVWRRAGPEFAEANALLSTSFERAIALAEDLYIARFGSMHGVAFRVLTKTETLSGTASIEQLLATSALVDAPT